MGHWSIITMHSWDMATLDLITASKSINWFICLLIQVSIIICSHYFMTQLETMALASYAQFDNDNEMKYKTNISYSLSLKRIYPTIIYGIGWIFQPTCFIFVIKSNPAWWGGFGPAWISNYIYCIVWDEITFPFPNFNGCKVEIWEWLSNSILHCIMDVIIYPCWD